MFWALRDSLESDWLFRLFNSTWCRRRYCVFYMITLVKILGGRGKAAWSFLIGRGVSSMIGAKPQHYCTSYFFLHASNLHCSLFNSSWWDPLPSSSSPARFISSNEIEQIDNYVASEIVVSRDGKLVGFPSISEKCNFLDTLTLH